MKKLSVFVSAISIALFTISCDNDGDNNGGTTSAPLVGKWNVTKVGTTVAGQEVLIDPPQNESGCAKDYIEFNNNNTATAGDYDSSNNPCQLTTTSGTYSRTGNQLTTVIDATNRTEEILNLTETELKVRDETDAIVVFTKA